MALFGMVWLLRVRSEMRRCSKCRHEEMLAQQQQLQLQQQQQQQQHQLHHHHQHHQQQRTLSQTTSLLQTMSDDGVSSSANTLFTLDTPGAAGPAGSYCEVHGYVQAKEGRVLIMCPLIHYFQKSEKDVSLRNIYIYSQMQLIERSIKVKCCRGVNFVEAT